MKKIVIIFLLLNIFAATHVFAATPPLIGVNYSFYNKTGACNFDDFGIVKNYDKPGIRATVQSQLSTMRASGIQTLRVLLWFQRTSTVGNGTIITIPSTTLPEPYRTNLINFLTDIKNAGYLRLTFAFAGGLPTKEELWKFIADVRPLVKQFGPGDTRISLGNESGAPSKYQANYQNEYDKSLYLYKNYAAKFGTNDVITSAVVSPSGSGGATDRIQNLINLYKESGYGQPAWFELHSYGTYEIALSDFNHEDNILAQNGLKQPFVFGETPYNDPSEAKAVKQFISTHTRRVEEVIEWPLKRGSGCRDVSEGPPFSASAFLSALSIPAPTPTPTTIPGDLTSQGDTAGNHVNIYDYNILIGNFGKTGSNIVGDINKDNKVDIFDYNILVGNFGK